MSNAADLAYYHRQNVDQLRAIEHRFLAIGPDALLDRAQTERRLALVRQVLDEKTRQPTLPGATT